MLFKVSFIFLHCFHSCSSCYQKHFSLLHKPQIPHHLTGNQHLPNFSWRITPSLCSKDCRTTCMMLLWISIHGDTALPQGGRNPTLLRYFLMREFGIKVGTLIGLRSWQSFMFSVLYYLIFVSKPEFCSLLGVCRMLFLKWWGLVSQNYSKCF